MDDFLIRAVLAGIGVAVAAGPLGCFVVWRRMAYFGDTLAHSALLGVAVGFIIGVAPTVGTIAIGVTVALVLVWLQQKRDWSSDTLLGLLSHTTLAGGLIAITFLQGIRIDLMAYLFGDILSVSVTDVIWTWVGAAVITGALAVLWRPLVALTVNKDIARAEGISGPGIELSFVILIAILVAISMKIVGILLITAMLVIPPATARHMARTPEQMAVFAIISGCVATALGLFGSYQWDVPAGPAIVLAAAVLFAFGIIGSFLRTRNDRA
ncbi:MAG: metal ABC transporter permease [Rhodospirillaceae bacterium]|nr:metal ABC transporter permease [Rhodospirillaceae bacterium]